MNKRWAMLGGLGLGAGLMYILDPVAGRKRRKEVAEKTGSLRKRSRGIGRVSRDIGKEAWGLLTEAQGVFEGREDDETLTERVRARLQGTLAAPETVQVQVENGVVTLAGTVGAGDFDRLISSVLRVKGVRDVNDQLDVRPTANGARDFEDTPAE